jgi:hypothetical protein
VLMNENIKYTIMIDHNMSYHDTMMRDVSNKYKNPKPRFRLETQDDNFIYKPEEREFSFYQICRFPVDKRHKVRKYIYNELGEVVKVTEDTIKKSTLDRFLKGCPKYKFTIYPTYDLDVVGDPTPGEISQARSLILNSV